MDDKTDSEWIASEGWPVMALGGGVTILLTLISLPLGCFALGLLVWLRQDYQRSNPRESGAPRKARFA